MSATEGRGLGRIDHAARSGSRLAIVRLLLPLGWLLAAAGYYGPWIAHATAALTLSGVDMAEFVKFLPAVRDGTLPIARQLFYLPPVAVVVGVALLVTSRRLAYPWLLRLLALALCVPLSLQLLPPAWSPASLGTPEFRLQALALGLCWLLLAASWLLGRLPAWLSGLFIAVLALAAGALSTWQLLLAKPYVDAVYGTAPALGWGFFLCLAGLAIMALVGGLLVLQSRRGDVGLWAGV
jgi:hypothetical protein